MLDLEWWAESERILEHVLSILEAHVEVTNMEFLKFRRNASNNSIVFSFLVPSL